jgi:hypothetical protein
MASSNEMLKDISMERLGELSPRLDAEFEEYEKVHLAGVRKDYEMLVKRGYLRQEELEPRIAEKQQEFASMDSLRRIELLVNNLHSWFPGGHYRQLLQERKARGDKDTDRISALERIVKDLDEVIREQGYELIAKSVAEKSIDRKMRLAVLADVYLKMRERGYDRSFVR